MFKIFTGYIAPICLPNVNVLNKMDTYTGSSFVVSGWSRTEHGMNICDLKQ